MKLKKFNVKKKYNYIFLALITTIFLAIMIDENCYNKREGFIGEAIGKLIEGVLSAGGSMFKPVIKAVKQAKGIIGKIIALITQLVIMGLTIIFFPFATLLCAYLLFQLIMFFPSIIKLLMTPTSVLELFGCDLS